MLHSFSHLVLLLRPTLVPALIIIILVLMVIIVWLLLGLRRFRSLQPSPQYQSSVTPIHRDPIPQLQPLPWSPPAAYPNPLYTPAEPPLRGAVVKPSPPSDIAESSLPSQPISIDPDDLLNNKRWLKLVEECVGLFDDLDRNFASFDPARQELAEHVLLQLQEILERSNVELITGDATFERRRHQPEPSTTGAVSGTPIIETLSPGFAVGRRVLRRARVRLAEMPSFRNGGKRNEE